MKGILVPSNASRRAILVCVNAAGFIMINSTPSFFAT